MEILVNPNINFMKYRKFWVWVSLLLLVVGIVEMFVLAGINLGIDFAGGTQLTVRLRDEPNIDTLRRALEDAGQRDAQLQRFGTVEEREILIKTPIVEGSEEGSAAAFTAALHQTLNREAPASGFDLNQRGSDALANLLAAANPDRKEAQGAEAVQEYSAIADAIVAQRNAVKIFTSWDQVQATPGLSSAGLATLKERTYLGAFHVIQVENVGPQIGAELRRKGILAVALSLLAMLIYIWFRFELRFGVGAVVAVFHDVFITMGLFALFNFEFNLSTIAAVLTLVGYSVNDTVVIFDRVRENMRQLRRKSLVDVINLSINQTLSRTILTGGTTLLTSTALYYLGGDALKGFAFIIVVGVIIGTYSSIFIASPITLLWEQYFGGDKKRESSAVQAA